MGSFSYSNTEFGDPGFYPVRFGRYCSIARGVTIAFGRHPLETVSTSSVIYDMNIAIRRFALDDHSNGAIFLPVNNTQRNAPVVGNDVWIGMNCILNTGITIGDGAVIAAGSVVTKDVLPYSVVGGNPARFLKWRFSEEAIARLMKLKWWRFAPWQLGGYTWQVPERFCDELEQQADGMQAYAPKLIELWSVLSQA